MDDLDNVREDFNKKEEELKLLEEQYSEAKKVEYELKNEINKYKTEIMVLENQLSDKQEYAYYEQKYKDTCKEIIDILLKTKMAEIHSETEKYTFEEYFKENTTSLNTQDYSEETNELDATIEKLKQEIHELKEKIIN